MIIITIDPWQCPWWWSTDGWVETAVLFFAVCKGKFTELSTHGGWDVPEWSQFATRTPFNVWRYSAAIRWYSAAKVLRRPCGRFIPSFPTPSFPQAFSPPPSPFSLPFSFPSLPFPAPVLYLVPFSYKVGPLKSSWGSAGVQYVSPSSGTAEIEFVAF